MASIMIVDDDVDLASDMAQILKTGGHRVEVLNTVKDAVSRFKAVKPDLIVLDIMFPDDPSAGVSLAIEIRREETLKKIPLIMLSCVNEHLPLNLSSADIHPQWMPVDQFAEKPVDAKKLLKMVADALAHRKP